MNSKTNSVVSRTPRWLIEKRHSICLKCDMLKSCTGKFSVLDYAPNCPKGLLKNTDEEIAAKSWPAGAPRASGCCDSALNY